MAATLTEKPPTPPRPPRPDRGVKLLLLGSSAVTLALLVGAMVRENFLSEWRHHQRDYRELLLASGQEQQRQQAEKMTIEIRQVDIPRLGATDRCLSCHLGIENPAMADAPQPHRFHSGDALKYHPVSKYGCTVCHQGQGQATTFREAKGSDVHWDYPLLPARLTQASCGRCHAAGSPLMTSHAPGLARGRQLFLDLGCQSCHKLDGVGGQLGPALDGEGDKIRHQLPMGHVRGEPTLATWLSEHFASPQVVVPGSQMPPPRLTPEENEALTIYMLSLTNRDLPGTYLPADRLVALAERASKPEMNPAVLYDRLCQRCHGDGTYSSWDKFFGRFTPAVRGPGVRAVADRDFLRATLVRGRPGTLMPGWGKSAGGLNDAQIERLVEYLIAGDDRPPQRLEPAPTPHQRDASRGGELFAQLCAGCHAGGRLAPALGNPVFQDSASDELIARTIINGRQDTAMPRFQGQGAAGLEDDEVRDLVAYIRSLGRKR